jgi:hypothetical protein
VNLRLDLLGSPRRPILLAGRTPAAWQRAMARGATGEGALRRAALWIKALIGVRPVLCHGALLGSSLDALAGQVLRPQAPPEEDTPPRYSGEAWHGDAPRRQRRDSLPGEPLPEERPARAAQPSPSRHRVPPPLQSPPQIERGLLEQLAGAEAPGRRPGQRTRPAPSPGSLRSPLSAGLGPPQDGHQAGSATLPTNEPGLADWLRAVARRATRTLQPDVLNLPEFSGPDRGDRPAGPWATRLDGPSAPAHLLVRRSPAPPGAASSAGDRGPRSPGIQAAPGGSRDRLDSPAQGDERHTTAAHLLEHLHSGPAPAQSTAPDLLPTPSGPTIGPDHQPTLLHSLDLSPDSPSIRPQSAVHGPAPGAHATVGHEREAEHPAWLNDDLSQLAARLQRILIEEARRHGMDVG